MEETKRRKSQKDEKNSKSIKRVKSKAENEEEQRLTALLFGNGNVFSAKSASVWHDEDDDENDMEPKDDKRSVDESDLDEEEYLFHIDRMGDISSNDYDKEETKYAEPPESDEVSSDKDYEDDTHLSTAAAWVDEDDHKLTVSLVSSSKRLKKLRSSLSEDVVDGNDYQHRLRERFHESSLSTSRTDWARVHPSIGGDIPMASTILSSTRPLVSTVSSRLPPNILEIIRRPDANQSDPNQSVVQAINFHPGSDIDTPLLLTAGLDKTLRFFRILDDKISEKIHGVHFPNLPIYSASFLGDTGSVVVSGRRKFFYVYDAVTGSIDKIPSVCGREEKSLERHVTSPDGKLIAFMGNDGYILLVEAATKLWMGNLKMNGSCRALCFSPDGRDLISSGGDGDIYSWDIRTHKCKEKFSNEDGTITSSLSMSSQFMAVGAESGVVNLYQNSSTEESSNTKRSPVKRIMNLKTSVDFTKFNHNGEILAMSTRREKDGLKLLHLPSRTVFSNWPTSKTPLGYVWSLDFSPGSKFMAIGNDKGKCLLYRLKHYHESS